MTWRLEAIVPLTPTMKTMILALFLLTSPALRMLPSIASVVGDSDLRWQVKAVHRGEVYPCNLADVGLHASLLYYLKARFHFNKDQFADLMVITGVAGTISQLLLMPIVALVLGEERLLSIGLFFNCAHLQSIISKQVGPCEQVGYSSLTQIGITDDLGLSIAEVGVGLMALQQFGGVNGIAFYASAIFISVGSSLWFAYCCHQKWRSC